jgi:hypothetical protein
MLVIQSMLQAIFDRREFSTPHTVVLGSSRISATFMKHTRKKMPEMVSQERFFHQGNTLVHTVAIVQTWMTANKIQLIHHLPRVCQFWLQRTTSYSGVGRRSCLAFFLVDLREPQEVLGRARQEHRHDGGVCSHLQEVVQLLQQVHLHQGRINREIRESMA